MTSYKKIARAFKDDTTNIYAKPKKKRVYDRNERIVLGLPPLEDDLQSDVIDECKYIKYKNKKVADYIHHSPNGGYRNKKEAARFKKMGTKSGFPDLFLFITTDIFKGLFIEMKTGTNTVTEDQESMHRLLIEQGYKVVVVYSVKGAINAIKEYLNIDIK